MAKAYTNRRGKTYFIKKRKTKTGKTTYTMTMKESADCVDEEPQGYEVHELPENGQMVIRKKLPSEYGLQEINLVKKALQRNKAVADYQLDVRGKELVIYTSDTPNLDVFVGGLERMFQQQLGALKRYEARMKIIKSKTSKEYEIQRFCYRGSVDDWITIGMSAELNKLVDKYIPYLGSESYYELGYNYGE